ncbi:MAG: hypothetical protein QXD41_02120 [Nitrososphaeria archaeon]
MNNLKVKLATGVATAALLATTLAPVAFASTNTISGNGAGSTNKIKIKNINRTTVNQSNATAVINLTGVLQNTGSNTANNNTGNGNITVNSGNANSTVTNTTTNGSNTATVNLCGCPTEDTTNEIKNNGAESENKIRIKNVNNSHLEQINETLVVNGTLVAQNTGSNHANNNTGDGDVTVDSGNTTANVTNTTTTGSNVLNP